MRDIGTVNYHRCKNCGFVISKTHSELNSTQWARNERFHHFHETTSEKLINQPPYAEQALMLFLLSRCGILDLEKAIDFAAGYGTLSRLLQKYFQVNLPIYDLYVRNGNDARYIVEPDWNSYKTVINSAMFEHVLNREDLDRVDRLVATDGCLVIHTVVCENIPEDGLVLSASTCSHGISHQQEHGHSHESMGLSFFSLLSQKQVLGSF